VDATTSFIVAGMTGAPVDLIIYEEGLTRLVKTHVDTPTPLRLKVVDGGRKEIRSGRRVMLLSNHEGLAMRADGHLNDLQRDPSGMFLDVSNVHWELLERRRHVRVPVNVPITLRTVVESQDSAAAVELLQGATMDMSVSGAFVRMEHLPVQGSLVEFVTELEGVPVRVLAVVAHLTPERKGVGLHFVEYLDNARLTLQTFLTKAA
jgi:hypothetical protein